MATFDANYPQNMWLHVENKTRDWYVPDLYRIFVGQAVYNNFVDMKFNMNGLGATQMFIDQPIMPHTVTDSIGARDLWLDTSEMDSKRRAISFTQYGGKFSYHKYDEMITYWRQNGVRGLRRLIDAGMGWQITMTLEKLARNVILSNPFATYGTGSGTKFNTIQTSDTMTTQKLRDMWLGLRERGTPNSEFATFNTPNNIFCITSPGVIADLMDEVTDSGNGNLGPTFTDIMAYADPGRALNGEIGSYQRVRFIESNLAVLWNCGDITVQPTVSAAIHPGDGSPDPDTTLVDGVFKVGQPSATHSIAVSSTTGISAGDTITIHKLRTNDFGITNGVDYRDGKLHNRVVHEVVDATHLSLTEPIMVEFDTDLGGGVYAYVTKGRHIHTATFMPRGFDGVVTGILQPPLLHLPDPVDDRQAQFRFTWDAYLKYQLFNPQSYEVLFLSGSNRYLGARYVS